MTPAVDPRLREFVQRAGLVPKQGAVRWSALAGGVSSDIWRVDVPGRTFCVKCALPKLRVAREWHAPVERNASEWAWMRFVHGRFPAAVPEPLAHDAAAGAFAMAYLPEERFPVWKACLLRGEVDVGFAGEAGRLVGRIHAASAHHPEVGEAFRTDATFHAIRLEPYLIGTGVVHPDLAPALQALADSTIAIHQVLVHGDVSPKNILVGPEAPVLLDAECAWFGDPAFDLAFCLNHFLLKCLARRRCASDYLRAFDAFAGAYLAEVTWEPRQALERRAAQLLPALFLARIDGKSPVEYVTDPHDQDLVRSVARPWVIAAPLRVRDVRNTWDKRLAQ